MADRKGVEAESKIDVVQIDGLVSLINICSHHNSDETCLLLNVVSDAFSHKTPLFDVKCDFLLFISSF